MNFWRFWQFSVVYSWLLCFVVHWLNLTRRLQRSVEQEAKAADRLVGDVQFCTAVLDWEETQRTSTTVWLFPSAPCIVYVAFFRNPSICISCIPLSWSLLLAGSQQLIPILQIWFLLSLLGKIFEWYQRAVPLDLRCSVWIDLLLRKIIVLLCHWESSQMLCGSQEKSSLPSLKTCWVH